MILKVARLGHPVLRERASDVDPDDIRKGKFRSLIEDMIETMHAYQGIGLAGPQVHLPLRIFVLEVEATVSKKRGVPAVEAAAYFNATLELVGEKRVTEWEGCLSAPFLAGEVPRADKVVLRALDATGEPVEQTVRGYTARILQHEIDHTNGHVYLDRMPDLRSLTYTVTL